MNCRCCGQPLTIQKQPALSPRFTDMFQVECRNEACTLNWVTRYFASLDEYTTHDFSDFGFVEES